MGLVLYTDGGCHLGIGTWAYALVHDDLLVRSNSGLVNNTTNNRMELMAILQGVIRELPGRDNVIICSDSRYSIDRLQPLTILHPSTVNVDLINQTINFIRMSGVQVKFKWIKGHSKHKWNDFVDKLCTDTRKKLS